jgi:nucleolar complex protein 2
MASDKRTKKFNKKHLQSHLKERRKQKAIKDKKLKSDKDKAKKEKKKQKIITAEKEKIKKAREAEEANQSSEEEGEDEINLLKPTKKSDSKKSKLDDDFEGMEVLQDDVEISSDDEPEEDDAMDVSDDEVDDEEDTAMDISDDEEEEEEDDEDEDDEEDDEDEVQDDGEDVDGAIETMKQDMEALKEKDPNFYKYLQENDKGLLDFDVQDEEEEDEDEDEDQEDEADSDDDSEESGKSVIVSLKLISNWEKQITEEKTHKACSQLLDAFKVGAHLHDDKKEDEDEDSKPEKYKINSDKVFNQLMVKAMKLVPAYFNDTIKYKPNSNKLPNTYQNWKSIHNLAKSYLSSCLHMLQQLTEPTMLTFMLDRFDSILVYFASFPKLSRDLVKTLLKLFGSSQDDKVRLLAFITLKNLSRASKEFLDLSLKGVYMSYIRNAKNVTAFNLPQIEMMRNCGVELYGQDFAASYQHAFQFIRRLATHLRTSLTNKTKDSYQQVYNNQFIHSIYFWSQVLCSYCNSASEQENGESPLKPLIYPFVQVTLGTLSLIPSPKYFPLKFHCIKALIPIMQSTKVYIPIAPYLIEVILIIYIIEFFLTLCYRF